MAKGQMRSNREKKKPKADKTAKKNAAAPPSVAALRIAGKAAGRKPFS
jgi:hypothetical protein